MQLEQNGMERNARLKAEAKQQKAARVCVALYCFNEDVTFHPYVIW